MLTKSRKPFIHRCFKILLLLLFFTPAYTQIPYDPIYTPEVIASVLSQPLIEHIAFLLPLSKVFLFLIVIAVMINPSRYSRLFFGYYIFLLIIVGIFQNMAVTQDYGFSWLIGNSLVIFIVAGFCLFDFSKRNTIFSRKNFEMKRLWVLIPMLLAFLMPYSMNAQGVIEPGFGWTVFMNESGVTYCMITPVMVGVMILFLKDTYQPTLFIVSFIGFVFGLMNMLTWFVFQAESWWMGVLHLPLMILSSYALYLNRLFKAEKITPENGKR